MDTRRLTETAFNATITAPMREVTGPRHDAVEIGPYVDAVPPADRENLDLVTDEVKHVWRDAYDRYDHVLLPLKRDQTYLVVVVDLKARTIHGHHVLDLGGPRGG